MNSPTKIEDRIWYRKFMRMLTREQLEKDLEEKISRGEITEAEAEDEWQDFMHRGERWNEF